MLYTKQFPTTALEVEQFVVEVIKAAICKNWLFSMIL